MRLFDALTTQRRVVYLAVVLLSAAGVWRGLMIPSAIYPELTFPRITVVAEGTSLGARQQAFSVTRPLEEAVSTVQGVTRVTSRSIRGATEISVTFAPSADMTYALQQTQARVNQTRTELPNNVTIEVERLTPSLFPILSYNLEGGDPATQYDIARYQIAPLFARAPGVGRISVQGSDIHEIEVVADPARLAEQGLTYTDLANAIQQSISVAAVGRVAKDYKQYLVVTDQEAHTPEDVGNVALSNGLRVRDVATVSLSTEDRVSLVAGDGKPAALINITRQIGGNTIRLADSIAAMARTIQRTLPAGMILKPVYDQASLVQDAVTSVRDAMLIGALLAIIILFAFLQQGWITAVSASAIPLTMAITVFIMSLIGQTFNLMTLGAMAIAIGLVIDDAVVVTENIVRHLAMTPDRHRAIGDAVRELLWPVTTSTLTTVVVFLPLALLTGVVGQFFTALSITLTIAVLVSLVLAFTIIPLLSDQFVKERFIGEEAEAGKYKGGVLHAIARLLNGLGARYERSLDRVVHHPRIVLGVGAVLLVLGYVAYQHVGTGFLPDMDEGAFVMDYMTPGGTALTETGRQIHIAEQILMRTPEITALSRRTGAELGLYATKQNSGDLVARLRPPSQRSRDIFAVINSVRDSIQQAVPQLHIEFVQILSDVINDLAGAARPVEVKMFGANLDTLDAYAKRIAPRVERIEGIEDLTSGVSQPSAELYVHVDPAQSSRIGMTPADVGDAMQGALLGIPAGEIRSDDRAVNVRVRAPNAVRNDATRLAQLPLIERSSHRIVPLGVVATLRPVETRAEYTRENQQQLINMTADVSNRALGDVMHDVSAVLVAYPPPHGVRIELGGQYASQQEAFRALLLAFVLAVLCVVMVMVVQFRSFVEPIVVLLAAPVSFVGGLALLMLTGTPLNVSSSMGCIVLVGLIVKNGIILLDFTDLQMRQEQLPLDEALRKAGRARLRPILMTTLCTVFGLFPLALGLGAGSELQRPLALMTIGGLALSTPVTLYIVPALLVTIRGRAHRLADARI